MSLNRVTVIGHVGQDPQLRFTPQGNPVCTLSVATDESYTNKETGERKEAVGVAPHCGVGQTGHQLLYDAHQRAPDCVL